MLSAGLLSAQASSPEALPADNGLPSDSGKFQSAEPAEPLFSASLLAGWGSPKDGQPLFRIEINIPWETNGPARLEPAENLPGLAKGSPLDPIFGHLESATWTCNGSSMDATGFATTREGSIISVINDPATRVNHAGADRDDGAILIPDASLLPPHRTPVKITLRGPPAKMP